MLLLITSGRIDVTQVNTVTQSWQLACGKGIAKIMQNLGCWSEGQLTCSPQLGCQACHQGGCYGCKLLRCPGSS